MTEACLRSIIRSRRRAAAAVCCAVLGAAPALAEPHDLERSAWDAPPAPFLLTFQRPDRYMEITGVAEGGDGRIWVTGYAQNRELGSGYGYLAAIGHDGTLVAEHEIAFPDASVTQFWWPAPLADGSVAVAAALDPFTEAPNGALAIVGPDGAVRARVLLTELGLAGGDVVHVGTYPGGDLAIAGSATLAAATNGAMLARLGPDLSSLWVATKQARDPGYTLAAYASVVLADGSLAAIGTATNSELADGYGWLARFDASGNELWRQWLTGGMLELIEDAAQIYGNWVDEAPDGAIVYLQSSYNDFGEPVVNTLVRRSISGQIVDQVPLVFAERIDLMTLDVTRNGDVIVAGNAGLGQMPVVARIAADGTVRWSRLLEDLSGGLVWGVAEVADGGIVAVGTYFPSEHGIGAGWVVRLGADGSGP
jgi:hypothetical protein